MNITTFEDAKIGEKAWCMRRGWGEIGRIVPSQAYPIHVYFQNGIEGAYTISGRYNLDDVSQMLFWDEVVIEAPKKPFPDLEVDTKVLVWCDNKPKHKRYFSHFSPTGVVCFDHGMTSWTTVRTSEWDHWELAEQNADEAKPLTTEELLAGGWWCDEVSEACRLVFESKGVRAWYRPWDKENYIGHCYIDDDIIMRSSKPVPDNELLQIHRIGNEFYWK